MRLIGRRQGAIGNRWGVPARLAPAMSQNFLSGTLDSRITFTRASTGTYFNSAGVMQTAAVDAPRFDYDPVTLQPKGLLIEGARTNLLLWSSAFDNAVWFKGAGCAVTPNAIASPAGVMDADLITIGTTDGGIYENVNVTASTVYTFSYYVRLGTMAAANYKFAIYDNTAGAMINADIVPTQTPTASGWTRITYTFTTPVGCLSVRVYPFRNASVTAGTYYLWGAQNEAGAFVSSTIPTTSAAVTRAADAAVMTGTNFSNWFNQAEGTFVAEVLRLPQSVPGTILHAARMAAGSGPRHQITVSTSVNYAVVDDTNTAIVAGLVSGSVPVSGAVKVANSYISGAYSSSLNGAAAVTQAATAPPSGLDTLYLGRNEVDSAELFGHIRRLDYYRTRLPNSELQRLTA